MPFEIVRNDITRMKVDAIVNAANSELLPGGGVCGAIFSAAGYDKLEKACRAIGHCDTGNTVCTDAFDLDCRYIFHTVGPIWSGGRNGEAEKLKSCYKTALSLAVDKKCESIAFPLISAGIYGYPKADALKIAEETIAEFLRENELFVYLVIFDKDSSLISKSLYKEIRSYIDDNYAAEHAYPRSEAQLFKALGAARKAAPMPGENIICEACAPIVSASLKDRVSHLEESFSEMLLRLIDERGMTDVEVYKRANIDRKLFSKLRKSDYNPSKQTAIALAIALRLNLDDTKDLLGKAGYTLTHSREFDVIIEYFIVNKMYDIMEINEALFEFDQKLLGA